MELINHLMPLNQSLIGYIYAALFCIVVAFSTIYIHETNHFVNPLLSVFLTFLICTLWFNLLNIKLLKSLYCKLPRDGKNFFIINIATAINWIATFEALNYISPILYISLFMGIIPITTYFVNSMVQKTALELKTILFALVISIILIAITLTQVNLILSQSGFMLGIIFTLGSSVASACYMVYSKRFENNLHLTASQIVAVRFHLLVILSGIVCLVHHDFHEINNIHPVSFFYLAFLSSIIPMFSIQKSISSIGALKTSFIVPFTPVVTYLILLLLHTPLPTILFPLLLLLCLVLTMHTFVKQRNISLIASQRNA